MTFPCTSSMITGMPLTPKRDARERFSSVFTWTTAACPASFSATVRTAGANEVQCGHQGAQNSASTGPGYELVKLSKLLSFSCWSTLAFSRTKP